MPTLSKQIETLGTIELRDAIVYRHMLADIPPDRANTRGARWNPPDIAAIYTSFERETALAEAEYYLSLNTPPLRFAVRSTGFAFGSTASSSCVTPSSSPASESRTSRRLILPLVSESAVLSLASGAMASSFHRRDAPRH